MGQPWGCSSERLAPAIFAGLAALTMKTITTSNWRPLRSALCTLLLGIAALWAMPRRASAQLYVSQSGDTGKVGEYNATTGAPINPNFITGLAINPEGLLLAGNTLFVANTDANMVGAYNAATGAAINANFITGLSYPTTALAVSGNTLFVANGSTVGEYNATTGGPSTFTQTGTAETSGGVNSAAGTASVTFPVPFSQIPIVTITGTPANVYTTVTPTTTGFYIVAAYTSTGLPASVVFSWSATGAFGITGLSYPTALAVSGNTLFVANWGTSTVGEYNATTGVAINANFITLSNHPTALAVSGNNLLVANYEGTTISEYNATTGAVINANFITGLVDPKGLALSGNILFVTNYSGTVGEYNATTGAVINANFIRLGLPLGIAVGGTLGPIANAGSNQTAQVGILVTLDGSASFDPSGQLPLSYAWSFVSQPAGSAATLSNPSIVNPSFTPNAVGDYVIQLVVTDAAGRSSAPARATVTVSTVASALLLYVGQAGWGIDNVNTSVSEYDATTGAAINADFITGLSFPYGLAVSGNNLFAVNGNNSALVITNTLDSLVVTTVGEYNATTGAAINANFITGLNDPRGLALSGNYLFVANEGSGTVGEYNATTGAAINASFITGLSKPTALALSGNNLYVANGGPGSPGTVGEYNATTGAAINASFITGLSYPYGLAVSGNDLFVANTGGTTIGEYNATTGAAINASFITGLNGPFALALSGNNLYVANVGKVGEYNLSTGTFNPNFITGLSEPTALAVAAAVSPQTQLTLNLRSLQSVIAALPPSAFKNAALRDAMLIEFDIVLGTITVHDYSAALQLLQNVILPQTNGCATTGAPDKNDWIVNCPDQSMVYTPLLNIIAEVKALEPPRR